MTIKRASVKRKAKRSSMARGYVVWEGPSPVDGRPIVAIVTMRSTNRKTGNMAQLWILRSHVAPLKALRNGGDASVCGACPLRGDGTGKGRACYVNLGRAPTTVYRAYRRGIYPRVAVADVASLLSGRTVRLGAYGDPAMLPFDVVSALVAQAKGWTGYTHQWRTVGHEWAGLLMASCDTVADRREARLLGWRSFTLVTDTRSLPSGMVECMATRERNPLQCEACLACSGTRNGTRVGAVDIAIAPHGSGRKYAVTA